MKKIKLVAISDIGREALKKIESENSSFQKRMALRMAQGLNRKLFRKTDFSYFEEFDDSNFTYIVSFSEDMGDSLNNSKSKLVSLLASKGCQEGIDFEVVLE